MNVLVCNVHCVQVMVSTQELQGIWKSFLFKSLNTSYIKSIAIQENAFRNNVCCVQVMVCVSTRELWGISCPVARNFLLGSTFPGVCNLYWCVYWFAWCSLAYHSSPFCIIVLAFFALSSCILHYTCVTESCAKPLALIPSVWAQLQGMWNLCEHNCKEYGIISL